MSSATEEIYDYLVIGSGFGGSVSAMRLSEKGYRVAIIEKGKEYRPEDFPKSNWNLRKFLWAPLIKCFGFQKLTFFKQVFILSGVGVGGGSLVYANTHMVPPDDFFSNSAWNRFGDWKSRLMPFYSQAKFMLGTTKNQRLHEEDFRLQEVARDMGRESTFDSVNVGVYFGDPKIAQDPYFGGLGPLRRGCVECAACMVGCRYDAKNTLDKNYLRFARRFGAKLFPETLVTRVEYRDQIYHVHTQRSTAWRTRNRKVFRSRGLVVSGGVLGTMELLLRQKYELKTMPAISNELGSQLRTNSEMLCGVQSYHHKLNHGIAISSVFNPDDHTHVEIVKYSDGSDAMGVFGGYPVGAGDKSTRIVKLLGLMLTRPDILLRSYFRMLSRTWARYTVIFLVMQTLESSMRMVWRTGWFKGGMQIHNQGSQRVPAHIPIGQEVITRYAAKVEGEPANSIPEVLFNMSTTAHILGGCPMGDSAENGVVDSTFHVFNYPNMLILDGSIIQGNIGVNQSMTITALSEYAMSLIPAKPGNQKIALKEQLKKPDLFTTQP